jgi:uncharacterized protein
MRTVDTVDHKTDSQEIRVDPACQPQTGHKHLLDTIRRQVQQVFANAAGSHDWQHSLRVHKLCLRIGPKEGADMTVLEAAAYLHDIGRLAQDKLNGSLCHAEKGAQLAEEIIAPLALTANRKQNIIHCVRSHRYRDDCPPKTIEAKILFDADKLDAIGAIGVARAYQFAGELGACLHNPDISPEQAQPYSINDTGHREYAVKLSKIKNCMMTEQGRCIAQGRHEFMAAFFERFLNEYAGCD